MRIVLQGSLAEALISCNRKQKLRIMERTYPRLLNKHIICQKVKEL